MSEGSASYLKTEFLRALAHALRSPVGVLGGALDELGEAPAEDAEVLLPMARRNLGRLRKLALRLDWIAELEEGALQPQLGPCDLDAVVGEAQSQLASSSKPVQASVPQGARAVADRVVLARAVGLVLENAVAFARSGVQVGLERSDGGLTLVIDDDGPGLAFDRAEDLFERYRSGRERGCRHDLAVGLSLARDYARGMGGDLVLEPGPEQVGTRCRITLPAARQPGSGAEP